MHELRPNRPAINPPSLLSQGSRKLQITIFNWFKQAQRIKLRLQIPPPPERLKNALPLFAIFGVLLGCFRRPFRFQNCPLCHQLIPTSLYFATESNPKPSAHPISRAKSGAALPATSPNVGARVLAYPSERPASHSPLLNQRGR